MSPGTRLEDRRTERDASVASVDTDSRHSSADARTGARALRAGRREHRLILLAIGLVGLHIVDDNYLQPEPGTSAGDHLALSEGAGGRVGESDTTGPFQSLIDVSMVDTTAAPTVFQNHGPHPRIEERIGRIAPRPLFLIYAVPGIGEGDIRQPMFYAAADEPKAIWRVPGSKHTGGLEAQPAEYERRVVEFLDRALLGQR